ncbi:Hint domain-containing protein [Gimesia aquarii]|nr:Hint domain-containing protein [Gimesia aquarii]
MDQRQANPQFALIQSGSPPRAAISTKPPLLTNPQQPSITASNPINTPTQKGTSMTDRRQPAPTENSKSSRFTGPLSWLSMFCLLGALVFGFGADKTDANAVSHIEPKTQVTDTSIPYKTADIKDVKIGERLLGKNPIQDEVDEFVPDIIPSEWRLLHLTMHKANGKRLDMQFLRPLDWIKSNGAKLGATIDLDLPEFGAKGPAKVVLIEPCPPIKSGPGNVVTGKFIHESDGNLIDLRIEGQQEATTVTANHRYWSADRQQFVEAGHLKPGEQVKTLAGLKQVVSITPRFGNETVYNLEVQGEHVYLVGSLGALVHNNYPGTRMVDIRKLIYPTSRPYAEAKKLNKFGKFDWDLYKPIEVIQKGRKIYLREGVTRVEAALRRKDALGDPDPILQLPAIFLPN